MGKNLIIYLVGFFLILLVESVFAIPGIPHQLYGEVFVITFSFDNCRNCVSFFFIFVPLTKFRHNDLLDWNIVFSGEFPVAFVMSRNGHNGAGAVRYEDIVGDKNRDFFVIDGIDGFDSLNLNAGFVFM